jgi:hypothetical protein
MDGKRRRFGRGSLGLAGLVLGAVALLACIGDSRQPDGISEDDLQHVVLVKEAVGDAYARLTLDGNATGELGNDDLIAAAVSQSESDALAAVVEDTKRLTGYLRAYHSTGRNTSSGVVYLAFAISLHKTPAEAAAYMSAFGGKQPNIGQTGDGGRGEILTSTDFRVSNVGEQAFGKTLARRHTAEPGGDDVTVYATTVTSRRGPTLAFVSVDRADNVAIQDEVIALARQQDARIIDAMDD